MLAPNELYKKKFHIPIEKLTVPFWGVLSKKHFQWNKKWQAPFKGMFSYQGNNLIRYFEYPWAFYAIRLRKGMRVLDFGGGLGGFQFVLSKSGLEVDNVDPGVGSSPAKRKKGKKLEVDQKSMGRLNKEFNTHVNLYNCLIENANLPSNSYDVVYSISVMEHLTGNELRNAMEHIFRILKPGGHFIMTTDLFPNVHPFTKIKTNRWGENVSIKKLVDMSRLKIVAGNKKELYGFSEFNHEHILENLERYFISSDYPALIQTVVLKKDK